MVQIPFPNQFDASEDINSEALGWAQVLVDNIGKIRINALAHGTATLAWPGGSQFSTGLTVTHNLGAAPQRIFCQATQAGSVQFLVFMTQAKGKTTFQVQGASVFPAAPLITDTTVFDWLAIA